jgi:hypothetical protein
MYALLSTSIVSRIRKQNAFLFILIAALSSVSIPASAQEIWMWGSPNVVNKAPGWEGVRADAGDMWKPEARWETVAGAVKVIQIPPGNIERARESDLQQALADIKRRHIALAVGIVVNDPRWPVFKASKNMRASAPRISPTMILSGLWRRAALSRSAKPI